MLVLFGILLLPAVCAWFARTTSGALWAASLPGAFSLFSLFRLWEMGQENSGGCGMGAGIAVFCALSCGLSATAAVMVALVRHSTRPAACTGEPDPGFSPEASPI